jgi:hypothetical protein
MSLKIVLILFFFIAVVTEAQEYNVKIYLLDGAIIHGELIKITTEGVDINPGGSVKYRFISAERISSVEIVELNKIIEYPLTEKDIPPEIKDFEAESVVQTASFPKFLGLFSLGYSSAGGDYYEGFNSGALIRLGLTYLFHDSDRSVSRFFVGFSYNHASVAGEEIFGLKTDLSINEYSFEFGRTTSLFEGGHYLYFLTGGVIVTNEVEINIGTQEGISSSVSVEETKAALRFEGGGSIFIGNKFSILISLGYDFILGVKQMQNSYYYNYYDPDKSPFTVAGGILNLSLGLTYGF